MVVRLQFIQIPQSPVQMLGEDPPGDNATTQEIEETAYLLELANSSFAVFCCQHLINQSSSFVYLVYWYGYNELLTINQKAQKGQLCGTPVCFPFGYRKPYFCTYLKEYCDLLVTNSQNCSYEEVVI